MEGTRDENGICDINASCDGTWQKRGYNSMNIIETVISSDLGKTVNYLKLGKGEKTDFRAE